MMCFEKILVTATDAWAQESTVRMTVPFVFFRMSTASA